MRQVFNLPASSLRICAELENAFPAGQVENLPHDRRVREVITFPFLSDAVFDLLSACSHFRVLASHDPSYRGYSIASIATFQRACTS